MADAEDLKSSGDFSSWGFESPPGYQFFFNQLTGSEFPRNSRVASSSRKHIELLAQTHSRSILFTEVFRKTDDNRWFASPRFE
jgi:hypothetical protein